MRHRIPNLFVISWLSLQIHHGPAHSLVHSSLGRRCLWVGCNSKPSHISCGKQGRTRLFQQRQYQDGPPKETTKAAEQAFVILSKRRKTWRRLRHLVELAQHIQAQSKTELRQNFRSVVDIGTDHGILPIALAATGQFDCVTGVDVSEQVLKDGARTLYQEVQKKLVSLSSVYSSNATNNDQHQEAHAPLPVEFILGNGLMLVEPGAADIVCIAGMGVHTMLDILATAETKRVGCQALLLQPTNSKPKNLMALYDTLHQRGWQLVDERIEKQSSRWYLASAFVRNSSEEQSNLKTLLPGTFLQSPDKDMKKIFDEYVQHHGRWLKADMQIKGGLEKDEQLWMETFHAKQ